MVQGTGSCWLFEERWLLCCTWLILYGWSDFLLNVNQAKGGKWYQLLGCLARGPRKDAEATSGLGRVRG